MINANELRLGNWYQYPNSKPFRLTVDDLKGRILEDLDIIGPIPLTPEILVAAGFRHTNSIYYVLDKNPNSEWQAKLYDDGAIRLTHIRINSSHVLGIYKYLHQLQNLHFALTGEELEIKL